jgi:hypothetical protein
VYEILGIAKVTSPPSLNPRSEILTHNQETGKAQSRSLNRLLKPVEGTRRRGTDVVFKILEEDVDLVAGGEGVGGGVGLG